MTIRIPSLFVLLTAVGFVFALVALRITHGPSMWLGTALWSIVGAAGSIVFWLEGASGYINLEGIDVEALRQALNEQAQYGPWESGDPIFVILETAESVLAALDDGTHEHGVVQQWCDHCGELAPLEGASDDS